MLGFAGAVEPIGFRRFRFYSEPIGFRGLGA